MRDYPRLKPLKLDMEVEQNRTHPIPGIDPSDLFVVIGEVGDTRHYVIARWSSKDTVARPCGILSGMYELHRFTEVDEEEL